MTMGALTAAGDEVVEGEAGPVSFAVAEPGRCAQEVPGRQSFPRRPHPLLQAIVVGNRSRTARSVTAMSFGSPEAPPSGRAPSLAEERPNVGRNEAGERERPVITTEAASSGSSCRSRYLGPAILELDHRLNLTGHRPRARSVNSSGFFCAYSAQSDTLIPTGR